MKSTLVNMNLENTSSNKILGMFWDTSKDEFKFQLNFNRIEPMVMERKRIPTKREFLAIVMSVYDPFGFLADFLVYMKVLLQLVWRSGIDWDQPLPLHLHERWCSWSKQLTKIREFRIPRCYSKELPSATAIELHTFVDSSEVAFSAVCYLRVVSLENGITVSFVIGKTKCAPVKYLSIPRLELQAALLGVRLHNTVLNSHRFKISRSIFWSDSKTVLHWICDDKRKYKTFVANRVGEILDSTNPTQWNWVSTHQNAADDATRDSYPPEFIVSRRWVNGPEWLAEEECHWPHQPQEIIPDEKDLELQPIKHVMMMTHQKAVQFNFARSSSYSKVLRTAGWIIRYIMNLKSKLSKTELKTGELTVKEISKAEVLIFRSVQQEIFEEEYQQLLHQNAVSKKSEIYRLTPALDDDGLIRLNGRIDNATTVPLFTRRPIILPRQHHLTTLVIDHYHHFYRHQNEELIMCEVRRKFWINGLRALVRSAKKRCQHCKNEAAKPETPQMGQLPADRLTPYVTPFTFSGLDYFGPVYVSVGRRREKRWVALFTCLTIRAIHLEIVESLSTDSCLMSLRNFFNLRGIPKIMRSDNATTFVGAKGELTNVPELYNQSQIISESTMRGMEWIFNCPANPSAGGCWERLVQSVKRVLKQSLKEQAPRVETLRSYLMEAANIVNSRPLTHIPVSSIEEDPLTPNHFLLGQSNGIQCPGAEDEKIWTIRKQWRIANALKNHFWRRWIREYLPTLARRTKDFNKPDPIKIGDLVIVCDEDVPRRQWIRGIVEKLFPAKDGQIRRVELRTNGRTLQRPVSKLAILDVDDKSSQDETEMNYGGRNVAASQVHSP